MEEGKIARDITTVIIGGSAGSLEGILAILAGLNTKLRISMIIVIHRKSSNDNTLVDLLNSKINWPVKEAEEKEAILPGHIYIAPADYHLLIENDHTFSLDYSEKVNYSRPSIDVTFDSAASVYTISLLAILLSGANADGSEGMKSIKARGGLCIVQEPSSADVDFMPRMAIENVAIDKVMHVEQMATYINQLSG
jgi:two-component system chemotaxis response regulator CheB